MTDDTTPLKRQERRYLSHLQRRLNFLLRNEAPNDWVKAEVAALRWAIGRLGELV